MDVGEATRNVDGVKKAIDELRGTVEERKDRGGGVYGRSGIRGLSESFRPQTINR